MMAFRKEYLYITLAQLVPRVVQESIEELMCFCEIEMDSRVFLGLMLIGGVFISLAAGTYAVLAFKVGIIFGFIPIILVAFILTESGIYIALTLSADASGLYAEEILPDALQLMASNLRAGLTPDRALLVSARPEFGSLERAIRRTSKEVITGKNLPDALLELPKNIKSKVLMRTIQLISQGIRSGGKIADLLEQTADDMRTQKIIQKEVRATVLMYEIFITLAVGFGGPLLFGVSSYLTTVLTAQSAAGDVPDEVTSSMPIAPMGKITIDENFVVMYAVACITLSSVFGSLIIGLLKEDNELAGVKFIPPLLVTALSLFFGVRWFIFTYFGSMLM
ncbi:MAG: type II secretion system F family protein [Candidatus Undinarchaeales archaeon]|jgi:flagellar protein FlaJ|nr:type II secretion system F family protein [Candidatus Undinarchaeales archaeon]